MGWIVGRHEQGDGNSGREGGFRHRVAQCVQQGDQLRCCFCNQVAKKWIPWGKRAELSMTVSSRPPLLTLLSSICKGPHNNGKVFPCTAGLFRPILLGDMDLVLCMTPQIKLPCKSPNHQESHHILQHRPTNLLMLTLGQSMLVCTSLGKRKRDQLEPDKSDN